MVVKNAGALSPDYFLSYLRLLLSTRAGSLEEAKKLTEEQLFRGDLNRYGAYTKAAYEEALKRICNDPIQEEV
ncbi:hypothetical protein C772_00833 [Bhargavaea cecembensis DSE10]|uniref:Uncharacterized protein n=1 Tax=Bhargavaea cecembensis DSE10 TaxID=1235279 RepID=M7NF53_9BACL|nr:hypothetical protein [Bhargavaea cecembensis]EMR07188.1 hypothetical protein C772_00833 [Bhargavaea cecembensis DSE10]